MFNVLLCIAHLLVVLRAPTPQTNQNVCCACMSCLAAESDLLRECFPPCIPLRLAVVPMRVVGPLLLYYALVATIITVATITVTNITVMLLFLLHSHCNPSNSVCVCSSVHHPVLVCPCLVPSPGL